MPSLALTWAHSVLKHALKCSDSLSKTFTRKELLKKSLEDMVKETGSIGKTPAQTVSATLQDLRNIGFINFKGKGKYELKEFKLALNELSRKESKGEKLVKHILTELGIKFETEKIFLECKYKRFLRFDFYFEKSGRGYVIEFDGVQHRKSIDFFGGEKAFEQTQIRDRIKNEFCRKQNIKLLRITSLDYNEAKSQIISFIMKKESFMTKINDLVLSYKDI